ncbi:MAG: hypothetical protein KAR36_08660 [Candidatus Latescibacteria bacterium]|nr:hypothetical protein [Candidatus Latescibacterota bacterium]
MEMNSVHSIHRELMELRSDPGFLRIEVLDHTRHIIKARLYFDSDLFIQVYRNDKTDATNFLLMYGGRRIYARDEKGSVWHRHPEDRPDSHDLSPEGQREIGFREFIMEVYAVLEGLSLI